MHITQTPIAAVSRHLYYFDASLCIAELWFKRRSAFPVKAKCISVNRGSMTDGSTPPQERTSGVDEQEAPTGTAMQIFHRTAERAAAASVVAPSRDTEPAQGHDDNDNGESLTIYRGWSAYNLQGMSCLYGSHHLRPLADRRSIAVIHGRK